MDWLVLSYSLSSKASGPRVSLWRRLRRLGAVSVAGGPQVLPDRPDCLEAFGWLAQENTAFIAIVIADIWQWTPFVFIMMIAALANVDTAVLEAARVDGANWWQTTFRVKLPMVMNVIAITLLMRLIDAFRVLEVIYILTFGGPGDSTEILSLHIYKTAFVSQRMGSAAAISLLLLMVVVILSWFALRLSNPLKDEER